MCVVCASMHTDLQVKCKLACKKMQLMMHMRTEFFLLDLVTRPPRLVLHTIRMSMDYVKKAGLARYASPAHVP